MEDDDFFPNTVPYWDDTEEEAQMPKVSKTFWGDDEQELTNLIIADAKVREGNGVIPITDGHKISLEQRVINLEGQTKVLYDRLEDIKQAPAKDKTVTIPATLQTDIDDMKTEIKKNIDSLTQAHLDYNEFLKTHPSDTEVDAKIATLNTLITQVKTTQTNAQLLINSNADKLKNIKSYLIPSNFRKVFRVLSGDGPTINPIEDTLTYGKIGQLITLDFDIPDEGCDVEIVINNVDPYSFYIPSYTNNGDDPLRARLQAGGLDFQVHGGDAKVQVWCTADPRHIGIFEWRTKWTKGGQ